MADLAAVLPKEYEYLEVENSPDSCQIRVKNITCADDAIAWLDSYSDVTLSTWRVGTTYPHVGKINVYRKEFRCQHRTDRRRRGQGSRSSKNTNCPAKIEVVIRRNVPHSRAKDADRFTEFPTRITFRKRHNHATSDPSALKHRDMSIETREKLVSLFVAGHGASSARNYLKMELLVNDRENYDEKLADGRYIPSTSVVSKLRKAVISELGDSPRLAAETCFKVTARELRMMLGKVPASTKWPVRHRPCKRRCIDDELKFDDTLSPSGFAVVANSMPKNVNASVGCKLLQPLPVTITEGCEIVDGLSKNVDCEVDGSTSDCSNGDSERRNSQDVNSYVQFVDSFCEQIKRGIVNRPELFVPAVSMMRLHVNSYPSTDAGLLNALSTMEFVQGKVTSDCGLFTDFH